MNVSLWLSVGVAVLLLRVFLAKEPAKWLRWTAAVVGVILLIQPVLAGLKWLGDKVGV